MPIYMNEQFFEKISFSIESDFENNVVKLANQIFGPNTIYLNIKKKIKGNKIGAIPDGYLIDMTIACEPKLYVVENEIVSHDAFRHIGIQMLKFATAFDEERQKIKSFLITEITLNKKYLELLESKCKESGDRNIDCYLEKAVFSEFLGLVIIDEARSELYKVLERINANISVLELKTYKSAENNYAYEFDTLYEENEEILPLKKAGIPAISTEERQKRLVRRANSDTIVVPAREDGFDEEFIKNNQWYAIRIGAAMKEKIKFIAAYQVAPISAVTHVAKVKEIKPYKDTGKYIVIFNSPAKEIEHKKLKDPSKSPQNSIYLKYETLLSEEYLDVAIEKDNEGT